MTELPTANFINSNPNPFTDGQTGSPPVILRVCTIHLSVLLLESYYIAFLVTISVQYFKLYQYKHNLVSCQTNCIQAASVNVTYSGMYK